MQWVYDDGGRARAGWTGRTGDCVCRAVSIATQLEYREVFSALGAICNTEKPTKGRRPSHPLTGVHKRTMRTFLRGKGWLWVPTMFVGSGCEVHLRDGELPTHLHSRLLVQVTHHLTAVIDGMIRDTHDPSRGGNRCVYGYWFHVDNTMESVAALPETGLPQG